MSTLKMAWVLMTTVSRVEIYTTTKVSLTSPTSLVLFDLTSCLLDLLSYISFFVPWSFLSLKISLDFYQFSPLLPNIEETLEVFIFTLY